MKKIKLDISYIGTAYCGWQVQPNAPTVQKCLQQACEKLFGCHCDITGCSRTDSGVHARSFICTVTAEDEFARIPCEKIPYAINILLPCDISVKSAENVDLDFHPRYSAKGKEYVYKLCDSPIRDPFLYGRVAYYPGRLDEERMNQAAKAFIGEHDFAAFMASGSKIKDTVRRIYDCRVERDGDVVTLTVSGNGFLYNMVRIIAGTLADVGRGKLEPCKAADIIASRDRSLAGQTLGPEGLYLNKVFYYEGRESEEYEAEKTCV